MARALGCEETRLRREFKAEYGTSLREYHQRLRVRRALVLIAAGPSKIAPIIRAVGYTSESHFYRAVRRLTGHTPAELAGEPHHVLWRLANELLPPRRLATQ
jgi:AraC-like DNA-binding protein